MPGFPLMAIGAGLGQFAQQYQQQQEARARNQMLMLTLAKYQQEQQDRTDKLAGAAAEWNLPSAGSTRPVGPAADIGGGTGIPIRGSSPGPQMAAMPPVAPDFGAPGEYGAGQARGGQRLSVDQMTQLAVGAGFSPETAPIMAAIAMPESGGDPGAKKEDRVENSYGLTQINANAHGPVAREALGNPQRAMELAYGISKGGTDFSPWTAYNTGAYRQYLPAAGGGGAAPAAAPARPTQVASADPRAAYAAAYDPQEPQGQGPGPQAATPAEQQQAQAGGSYGGGGDQPGQIPGARPAPPDLQKMLDAVPKPDLRSQVNEQKVKAEIQQQFPLLPPERKLEILKHKLDGLKLAEGDRTKLAMKDYDTRLNAVLETWKERNSMERSALEGGDLFILNGNLGRQKGNVAAPVLMGGQPVTGATRLPTPSETEAGSKNIEVVGPDGKEIFRGGAHKIPGAQPGEASWVDDKTQKRIIIPEGSELTIRGEGGEGRQAAGMIIRLTSAANEAKRQIANVSRASLGSTTSWFQGIQSDVGKDLSSGLGRSLANKITPREEQFMSVLGRGVGRSIASLETAGAATGLIALQQSMQTLVPAKGDDRLTALLKIAEMRQVAEQGIESAIAAPATGREQKALLRSVQDELAKAVPYTVADVLELSQKPGKDTYQTFAAKLGLGQKKPAAAAPAATQGTAPAVAPANDQAKGTQDILDRINRGELTPEAGKKLLIDTYGYTPTR